MYIPVHETRVLRRGKCKCKSLEESTLSVIKKSRKAMVTVGGEW